MNDDAVQKVHSLMSEAGTLGYGDAKLGILEEAVRLADASGDPELGFRVREDYISAADFSGYPEKSLVAFSWCLAQCDRDPERFSEWDLMWKYKWIAESIVRFSKVSREQIERTQADLERRYRQLGLGTRAPAGIRWKSARRMGNDELAADCYRKWKANRRDDFADCEACERNSEISYKVHLKHDRRALQLAKPILEGRLSCETIPEATLATVLLPLFRLDRLEEAATCHRRGWSMIARKKNYLSEAGDHLRFLVLTGNLDAAARVLKVSLPWAMETADEMEMFEFLNPARAYLSRLRGAGTEAFKLRLPRSFSGYREDDRYKVANLAAWTAERTRALADAFDARNGNDSFARHMAQLDEMAASPKPFPLPPLK